MCTFVDSFIILYSYFNIMAYDYEACTDPRGTVHRLLPETCCNLNEADLSISSLFFASLEGSY